MAKWTKGDKSGLYSTSITAHGITVRIFERPGTKMLWASVVEEKTDPDTGKRIRVKKRTSLETTSREQAVKNAGRLAEARKKLELNGVTPGKITMADLATLYLREKQNLSESRRKFMRTTLRLFRRHLGDAFEVFRFGQHFADTYVAARQSGKLMPPDRRASKSPEIGTIRNELAALSSVCNWAAGFIPAGQEATLLSRNPVKGTAPKYPAKARRRPRADAERYRALREVAGAIDGGRGQFRLALDLAWGTGRRIDAILHLKVSDLLFSRETMRTAMSEASLEDVPLRCADSWPAAIRWRKEHDKTDRLTITPVSPVVVEQVREYLRGLAAVGEAPLFPAKTKPGECTPKGTADHWLRRAERLAGLPRQKRGGWHEYRRGWAQLRSPITSAENIAFVGGWANTKTLSDVYIGHDPAGVQKVLEAG